MVRFVKKLAFLCGLLIGITLAVLLKVILNGDPKAVRVFAPLKYPKWSKTLNLNRQLLPFDYIRYSNKTFHPESRFLHDRIKILCIVLTKTEKNAKAARDTWGRRCNDLESVTIKSEKKMFVKQTKQDSSWVILCRKLQQVPDSYKWVVIVYDNTFVLVDNLRFFVAGLNPKDEYYLGHAVKFWGVVYNMGQAGYVLSKGAIKSFKKMFGNDSACTSMFTYRNQEDFYLGKSLLKLNVTPEDTRDVEGLATFHPYNLYHVVLPKNNNKLSVYPHRCCSSRTITFQAIEGDKMYTYYYLLYTVQLFHSGHFGNRVLANKTVDEEVWKKFLAERQILENVSAEQYYKIWENILDDPTSFARHMRPDEYFDYV